MALGFLGPVVFGASDHSQGRACVTAEGIRGRCIPVKQCPSIVSTMRKGAHTNEDSWFVYGSECGRTSDGKALVCCLQAASPTESSTTPPDESTRLRGDESLTSASACGVQPSAREVYAQGTRRNIGVHPWGVLLHNGNRPYETTFPCTGTLISAQHILTSAGCVDEFEKRLNLTVRLGEYDLESFVDCLPPTGGDDVICAKPSYDVTVARVQIHEGAGDHRNDIAVLRLSKPVQFSEWVFPICLPEQQLIDETATYHAASWNQNTCATVSNRHKLLSNHTVTNREACGRHLPHGTGDSFVCVSSGGQPFVDRGGALTTTKTFANGGDRSRTVHTLVGVLSSTATCANYEDVLVYTKVGPHLNWIRRQMDQSN